MEMERRQLIKAAGGVGLAAMASRAVGQAPAAKPKVIDMHTHNFTTRWVEMLKKHPDANTKIIPTQPHDVIDYRGAPIVRLSPEMTDFDMRIKAMDEAGVDVAIVSLTCPNVFWSSREVSVETARIVNDDFAAAEKKYPGRIKWMASLPWEHPDDAIAELERARKNGAVGICQLTNVLGMPLDHEKFHPVWKAIEDSGLPCFIHPVTPFVDIKAWGVEDFGLSNTIGFTSDTSLAFARLILTGFMDKFPKLELIACHGGGTLPYLIARFDKMWSSTRSKRYVNNPPSTYLRRFWYDAIVYDEKTLDFLISQVGADRVMYGSDYPFLIQDMPGVLQRVSHRSTSERDMILNGNATRLFKL
ncbi:MAG: amidohydrolase [Alphaproteobacteria bacterium]|nr:amidohydrolase [Alphaproteobacteria bacterium]MBU0793464.1 amidohydrolase [Alphaproteobacteria bacterium]MBU0877066.1 amidohydrolase [Alphaproteobacteria bacterium]MBU1770918.1 amidohydrolase [Alphaproteobacteria bacterium]